MFSVVSVFYVDIIVVFYRVWVDSVEVVCYKYFFIYIIVFVEIFKRFVNKVMIEICCILV